MPERGTKVPGEPFIRPRQKEAAAPVDMDKVRGEVRRLIKRCQEVTGGIRELSAISGTGASDTEDMKLD